ncbi:MAG TPA: DUF6569 family protein [Gemmataceae bacterium]|jgi:hypothetical protein|nr:DUF6569 family protein [Gemmataceae bacterium]
MSCTLPELFSTIEVTEPQQANGLQVFGLRWKPGDALNYATLDEALAAETLDVTEVNEGGSVPVLKVVNKSDAMVFLMAGEQLIGAKQNRVLNASIMVAGRSVLPIPVSCVEAGRWHYRSPKFSSGGSTSHGILRKMMSSDAYAGYRAAGSPTSDQAKIWGEVARKLGAMGSVSPSHALHQAYEDQQMRLSDVLGQLRVPQDCCGVAFVVAGKIAGVDLFDQPATLAKLFPKLLRAYALDALEAADPQAAPASATAVKEWLGTAAGAKAEPFKSPGLGYDVRLEGAGVVGAGLLVEEHPVHAELFADDGAGAQP